MPKARFMARATARVSYIAMNEFKGCVIFHLGDVVLVPIHFAFVCYAFDDLIDLPSLICGARAAIARARGIS